MGKVAIVGAGFSGAVIAYELAKQGICVDVYDERSHLGGNCHTERDPETNVLIHVYGPHIFHTDNERVWKYVQNFDTFVPFTNRVKAISKNRVFPLPINLMTINSFFGLSLNPTEAREFIESLSDPLIDSPSSFEEQALKYVGRDLYEAFFKGYTKKQWGTDPTNLPASILKRLPVRFNYDDNYYNSKFQGIPLNGYTAVIKNMLESDLINIRLNNRFLRNQSENYDHVFYSGPVDSWFDHSHGRLAYRTLDFRSEIHIGDYQGNAVINYGDEDIPYTRISEHKHFAPWETHEKTVIYKEFSRACGPDDIPYYPVRLNDDKATLATYIALAEREVGVTFVGRLGTYRYLDMHITIEEAIHAAEAYVAITRRGGEVPSFFINPLQ